MASAFTEAEAAQHEEGEAMTTDTKITRPDHWSVTVSRNGEEIVTIEPRCLSGRDLSPEDEATVRTAAENLLAFVGPERTPGFGWEISHETLREIEEMERNQRSAAARIRGIGL